MEFNSRREWLEWRHNGIGSSDAPIIHGKSPYKTRFELWEEKVNPNIEEREESFVQRIGNEMEPIARKQFAATFGMMSGTDGETFEPAVFVMKELPFMRASLDGISRDRTTLIEIKFQSKPWDGVKAKTKGQLAHEAVAKGEVPPHYWMQMQHQFAVSGAVNGYFISFDGQNLKFCAVEPDLAWINNHLVTCTEFWESVVAKREPTLTADDFKTIRKKDARLLADEYVRTKQVMDLAAEKLEVLKTEILKFVDHPRATVGSLRIVQQAGSKGAIDYGKVLSHPLIAEVVRDSGIDLDYFRKPAGKAFYKMTIAEDSDDGYEG